MVRLLAVSDEVNEALWYDATQAGTPDVLVSCGDLPFDYLDHLQSTFDVPLLFVPGNHDPDLGGFRHSRGGLELRAGMPAARPGPPGGVNVDLDVTRVAGLDVAGLGGCPRYRPGPNQWGPWQERRRAALLRWRTRGHRPLDVLLTHAPPAGCGDDPDRAHHGWGRLPGLVHRLRPRLLLHGHVHPHGRRMPDRRLGDTLVVNVVGQRLLELLTPEEEGAPVLDGTDA